MRKPMIAGNWKMNLDVEKAAKLAEALASTLRGETRSDILLCPTALCLKEVADKLEGSTLKVGAQNIYPAESGAFTGEMSAAMARSVGCSHVILGHSERRAIFGETDSFINSKMKAVLEKKMVPVLCVGETLAQRKSGDAVSVVAQQVKGGLSGVSVSDALHCVIAYEPVWAIGTGETASPVQADSMHESIRKVLTDLYGENASQDVRILYGGSVNEKNVDELMAMENIDGALVGGASLKVDSFCRIVRFEVSGH